MHTHSYWYHRMSTAAKSSKWASFCIGDYSGIDGDLHLQHWLCHCGGVHTTVLGVWTVVRTSSNLCTWVVREPPPNTSCLCHHNFYYVSRPALYRFLVFALLYTAVDCGSLSAPENGEIQLGTTTFGSTAIYSCNVGFNLVSTSRRVCTETGDWSGNAPVCQRKS